MHVALADEIGCSGIERPIASNTVSAYIPGRPLPSGCFPRLKMSNDVQPAWYFLNVNIVRLSKVLHVFGVF